MNDKQQAGFVPETHRESALRISKTPRGFLRYQLTPSHHTVLVLTRTGYGRQDSTAKLEVELVLELKTPFPANRPFEARDFVQEAIYRYGGPDLEFESRTCSGELLLAPENGAVAHGKVDLVFTAPTIDLVGVKEARVQAEF